jgi:hypothetical protein
MKPMQFARLFEWSMMGNYSSDLGQAVEDPIQSSDGLPYLQDQWIPICGDLVKEGATFSGYLSREVKKLSTSSNASYVGPVEDGTASLIRDIQDSGKRMVSVAALAGRPVQYDVCSGTRWDNRLVWLPDFGSHGIDRGGPQRTWIAFENQCPNYTARVSLNITPSGALGMPPHEAHISSIRLWHRCMKVCQRRLSRAS